MAKQVLRKVCFKCKQEKDISEFYKHSQMADGHLNKCKECTKKDVDEHRWANIEKIREYDRNRPNKDDRASKNQERMVVYRGMFPDRVKAKNAVNNAKRDGRLGKEPCVVCGEVRSVEAHHPDYSKPLDVIFLCPVHHRQAHSGRIIIPGVKVPERASIHL